MLFSRIPNLIHVHTKICDDLDEMIRKWPVDNLIGRVWMGPILDFKRVYPPYFNNYDEAMKVLNEAMSRNPEFCRFLKVSECVFSLWSSLLSYYNLFI